MIGNLLIPREKAVELPMLGHDFTAFYSAGHFARTGQFDKLYDVQAVKDYEQETGRRAGLSLGDAYGPYWNPPFYALIFAPLSALPYGQALFIWTLINLACGIAAVILLTRMLAPPGTSLREANIDWKSWALVPLLLAVSMPMLQCLSHGQNTLTSLLLLSVTATFWRAGHAVRAGLVAGLLFYKPQLGAIVAAVLVVSLGWRALLGIGITGVVLLLVTVTTMPGALGSFLHQLPINLRFMQIDHAYVWERHATLKAFWRLLVQGRGAGEAKPVVTLLATIGCVVFGVGLVAGMIRDRRSRLYKSHDRLIAATIATMPLLMPFYFDYDLMLLAIPAVLFAGERLRAVSPSPGTPGEGRGGGCISDFRFEISDPTSDRWLIRIWAVMFLWMEINPGIAASTRVNLTVPLLATVAGLLVARALRPLTKIHTTAAPHVTLPSRQAA